MLELSYEQIFIVIAAVWVLLRVFIAIRNGGIDWRRELQLLLVFGCIVVITRFVYFPMHPESGTFGYIHFAPSEAFPPNVNLVPFAHRRYAYTGWQVNLFGNIAMFIPVGIVWPICFKGLDSIGKTVVAGAAFSLLIELSQLFLYERTTDVDDLLMNTLGVLIGAAVYFGIKRLRGLAAARKHE